MEIKKDMTRFITLSNERSGSSFFQRLLDSHPQIRARQEDIRTDSAKNNRNVWRLLQTSNKELRAVGFKVLYNQMYPDLIKYCREKNIKIIQLIRRNLLETVIFNDRLGIIDKPFGKLGVYWEWKEPLTVDIDKACREIVKLRENIDKYRESARLTVYYKDVTGGDNSSNFNNKKVRNRVFSFLGVDNIDLSVDQSVNKKNKRPPLSKAITNFDELLSELEERNITWFYND